MTSTQVLLAACGEGEYSESGSTSCTACPVGTADLDSNPATPCTGCTAGSHGAPVDCIPCPLGTYDDDEDASTDCVPCVSAHFPGRYTECFPCPAGFHDNDLDPSTPCDGDDSRAPDTTLAVARAATHARVAQLTWTVMHLLHARHVMLERIISGEVTCRSCEDGTYDAPMHLRPV